MSYIYSQIKPRKFMCFLLYYINFLVLINNYSEIHLFIQGSGEQRLLNNVYKYDPSKVYVNGVKDESCRKTCFLEGDKNNITLIFEELINSCKQMFYNVKNILEIDLSNFDTSDVKTMFQMFSGCSNLKKINFGNINTSSVENMFELFAMCSE